MALALPWPLEEYRAIALKVAYEKAQMLWLSGFMWNPPGPGGEKRFQSDPIHRAKWSLIDDEGLNREVDDADGETYKLNKTQWSAFKQTYAEHTGETIHALLTAAEAIRVASDTTAIDAALDAMDRKQ